MSEKMIRVGKWKRIRPAHEAADVLYVTACGHVQDGTGSVIPSMLPYEIEKLVDNGHFKEVR